MSNEKEIEEIRQNANIIDIISSYLPLTQKGKNYFGVCPFHEDHSPSMSVSADKQIYKCFSCGAAGNVFTFVKDYENVSFIEAVRIVADKCGMTFRGVVNAKPKIKNYKTEYEIMDLTLKYYQNNLSTEKGLKAKEYLHERQMNEEAIKEFDLGLALGNEVSLYKLLLSKNYDIDILLNLGLVNRNGTYLNDVFTNRIIYPIHDLDGNPIGFTGRIYDSTDQAKYINSKESPIFKKGQILFNYHRAKMEIKRKKEVIIVEGNMDAIRMYISGIKNVIALMGTSLTKEQVEIIKKLRAKVILMLDNDEAGETATFNNGNILETNGIDPFVVRLSGEKDPDEYIIKNGVEAIINNINSPISFLDFKLNYFKKNKDLNKTEDLVSYIKEMMQSIKDIDDELTRNLTIRKMSEDYNIPLDLLEGELEKISVVSKKKEEPKVKRLEKVKISKYDIACQNIIYFMMNNNIFIEKFKSDLGIFRTKKYRNIANLIMYYQDLNENINLSSFITFVEEKGELYDDVMEIVRNVNIDELTMETFKGYINAALKETSKEEILEIKKQLNEELDENKKMMLLNKLVELKKGCVGK